MQYTNIKTQEVVTLISNKGGLAVIEDANGVQSKVTSGSLARWYKKLEDGATDVQPAETVALAETAETPQEQAPEVKEKPAKVKKEKKVSVAGNHPLVAYIAELAKEKGYTIFESTNANFKAVKDGTHYVMPFVFNIKNVVLWVKAEALKGIKVESKTTSHTYDTRVTIVEDTKENRALVKQILEGAESNLKVRLEARDAKKEATKAAKKAAKPVAEKPAKPVKEAKAPKAPKAAKK